MKLGTMHLKTELLSGKSCSSLALANFCCVHAALNLKLRNLSRQYTRHNMRTLYELHENTVITQRKKRERTPFQYHFFLPYKTCLESASCSFPWQLSNITGYNVPRLHSITLHHFFLFSCSSSFNEAHQICTSALFTVQRLRQKKLC